MNAEIRRLKTENAIQLAQNVWQDPAFFRLLLAVTSVDEHVLLSTVTMHIAKQYYLTLSLNCFDELFCGINGRVQNFVGKLPSTVQVASCK